MNEYGENFIGIQVALAYMAASCSSFLVCNRVWNIQTVHCILCLFRDLCLLHHQLYHQGFLLQEELNQGMEDSMKTLANFLQVRSVVGPHLRQELAWILQDHAFLVLEFDILLHTCLLVVPREQSTNPNLFRFMHSQGKNSDLCHSPQGQALELLVH